MSHTRKTVDEKTGAVTNVERVIFTQSPMGFIPHSAHYSAHLLFSQMANRQAAERKNEDNNQHDNDCTPSCNIL